MFQGRRDLVRMASIAAGAGCLALAACSSATSSAAAPSAASTADPLASLSAKQVAAKVIADAKAAASLTLAGSITQSSGTETINMAIKPGKGCTGTLGAGSHGSFKLTKIGDTIYLNPDKKFWESNAGATAAQAIALVNGRYLKVSATDKTVGSLATICDMGQMFSTGGKADTLKKGKVTTLDGTRVLALNDTSEDTVSYVTDTSKPQLFEMTAPKGAKNGSGKITVTYDTPVTLTAPPASQVLDGAQLGLYQGRPPAACRGRRLNPRPWPPCRR